MAITVRAEHALIRKLTGLATIDADIRAALATVVEGRLPLLTYLVDQLDAAGRLSPSCSPERAVDILWLLSSFEAFDQLFTGRRAPVDTVAELLSGLATQLLTTARHAIRPVES